MQTQNDNPIGQILVNGGFLSNVDLELALDKQRQSSERLGRVLVRMGAIDRQNLTLNLTVQKLLNDPDYAAKIAAGVREMLVQTGFVTNDNLDQALALQKESGKKIGEILLRMGLLNVHQLNVILDFQRGQCKEIGPLKFGEIVLAAGYISPQQLDEALQLQIRTSKKLSEVLIEGGFVEPHHVEHCIRMQQMLQVAVLAGLLTACGGGGGGSIETCSSAGSAVPCSAVSNVEQVKQLQENYFVATSDDYGLETPTFYYSTDNEKFWAIQADIAKDVYDMDFRCVMRIQISKETGVMPEMNKTFSIEDNSLYERFPGDFLIPNGQHSTYKKVEKGLISFEPDSNASGKVKGSFDIVLTDYDSGSVPAPQYKISGRFLFQVGTYNLSFALPGASS